MFDGQKKFFKIHYGRLFLSTWFKLSDCRDIKGDYSPLINMKSHGSRDRRLVTSLHSDESEQSISFQESNRVVVVFVFLIQAKGPGLKLNLPPHSQLPRDRVYKLMVSSPYGNISSSCWEKPMTRRFLFGRNMSQLVTRLNLES